MAPYERLAAWRLSYQLVLGVYDATDGFPKHELYGLTSQARRAAFSVVANINHAGAVLWRLYQTISRRRQREP